MEGSGGQGRMGKEAERAISGWKIRPACFSLLVYIWAQPGRQVKERRDPPCEMLA